MTLEQRVERIEKLLGLGEGVDPAAFAASMQRTQTLRSNLHASDTARIVSESLQKALRGRRGGGGAEEG